MKRVIYKTDKGSVIKKTDGYYVKINDQLFFVGEKLNKSFMDDFGLSSLIEIYQEQVNSGEILQKYNFKDF